MFLAEVELEAVDDDLPQHEGDGVRQFSSPLMDDVAADQHAVVELVIQANDAQRFNRGTRVAVCPPRFTRLVKVGPEGCRLLPLRHLTRLAQASPGAALNGG